MRRTFFSLPNLRSMVRGDGHDQERAGSKRHGNDIKAQEKFIAGLFKLPRER
jgi:hypothetical protein